VTSVLHHCREKQPFKVATNRIFGQWAQGAGVLAKCGIARNGAPSGDCNKIDFSPPLRFDQGAAESTLGG
jgi:hypothetical protein